MPLLPARLGTWTATILCMSCATQKVIVSRPRTVPAAPSAELRRADFCCTIDGELLTLPDFPCADEDCGCSWSFGGVTSASACTWGVVEERSIGSIAAAVASGKHLAGWSVIPGFEDHILASIRAIGDGVRLMPLRTIVGIWALSDERFNLFERRPDALRPPRDAARLGWPDREDDTATTAFGNVDFD